jgi:hypothetical protein
MAALLAPPKEPANSTDRFEQSRVFNKRHPCAGLLGFGHWRTDGDAFVVGFGCSSASLSDWK